MKLPLIVESPFLQTVKDWLGMCLSWRAAVVFIQLWRQ